jgi:hypothetical protein
LNNVQDGDKNIIQQQATRERNLSFQDKPIKKSSLPPRPDAYSKGSQFKSPARTLPSIQDGNNASITRKINERPTNASEQNRDIAQLPTQRQQHWKKASVSLDIPPVTQLQQDRITARDRLEPLESKRPETPPIYVPNATTQQHPPENRPALPPSPSKSPKEPPFPSINRPQPPAATNRPQPPPGMSLPGNRPVPPSTTNRPQPPPGMAIPGNRPVPPSATNRPQPPPNMSLPTGQQMQPIRKMASSESKTMLSLSMSIILIPFIIYFCKENLISSENPMDRFGDLKKIGQGYDIDKYSQANMNILQSIWVRIRCKG